LAEKKVKLNIVTVRFHTVINWVFGECE